MNKTTIVLDSLNRNFVYNYPYINTFNWVVSHNPMPLNQLTGQVYVTNPLRHIQAITVHSTTVPRGVDIRPCNGTLRCIINELPTKYYFSDFTNSTQLPFQYEFSVTSIGRRLSLMPRNETVYFNPPMILLDQLTISLYNPYSLYDFEVDYGYYNVTFGNPTLFILDNAMIVPLAPGQNLNNTISNSKSQIFTLCTGDTINVLSPILSGNTVIDNELNDPLGHCVMKIDNDRFSIPIDSSNATVASQTRVLVYYTVYRFHFTFDVFYEKK